MCVNWSDAKAYAAWLSKYTGKTYRLPSEAEREYVARAGTTTPFWWGATISTDQANYNGTAYGGGSTGEFRGQTVAVDTFAANPWGFYNVHGNVNEWTEDCLNDYNAGNLADGRARTSGKCGQRLLRGGNWLSTPHYVPSAARYRDSIGARFNNHGFRLARTLNS